MTLHGQSLIGDQLSRGTGETFSPVSPLNSMPLPPAFCKAGAKEVDQALQAAERAFEIYQIGRAHV